jgi:hypothetical protein
VKKDPRRCPPPAVMDFSRQHLAVSELQIHKQQIRRKRPRASSDSDQCGAFGTHRLTKGGLDLEGRKDIFLEHKQNQARRKLSRTHAIYTTSRRLPVFYTLEYRSHDANRKGGTQLITQTSTVCVVLSCMISDDLFRPP